MINWKVIIEQSPKPIYLTKMKSRTVPLGLHFGIGAYITLVSFYDRTLMK